MISLFIIPFSKPYDKLKDPVYTTIRKNLNFRNDGKFEKLKTGDYVQCVVKGTGTGQFGTVLGIFTLPFMSISTDLMLYDTKPFAKTRSAAILLFNEFYRSPIKPLAIMHIILIESKINRRGSKNGSKPKTT